MPGSISARMRSSRGAQDEAKQRFAKVLSDCDLYRSNFIYFSRSYGAAAAELKRLP